MVLILLSQSSIFFGLLLAVILIWIVIRQFKIYNSTKLKIEEMVGMFSGNLTNYSIIEDVDLQRVVGIDSNNKELKDNKHFVVIRNSINQYLKNNSGSATDFHIIKDIVDRNTDSVQSEISTQVPFPLYLGLMGTMIGIIIGVSDLLISRSLNDLLTGAGTVGISGIQMLLAGVAGAMITSVIGVGLTTRGSSKFKDACSDIESKKNSFLTWSQAKLLPELNTNFAQELMQMTNKLTAFNRTFSDNSRFLQTALKEVREATVGQSEMLKAVKDLNVVDMAEACAKTVGGLKQSIESIDQLSQCLSSSANYLKEVRSLNEKLDNSESRVHAMEEVACYFKEERTHLDTIKSVMAEKVAEIDTVFNDSISMLGEHTRKQISEMIKQSGMEYDKLIQVMNQQSAALSGKTQEISIVADELKQMVKVKDAIGNMNSSIAEQNRKLDKLIDSIRDLAMTKSGNAPVNFRLPKQTKIIVTALGGTLGAAGLTGIVYFIMQIFGL